MTINIFFLGQKFKPSDENLPELKKGVPVRTNSHEKSSIHPFLLSHSIRRSSSVDSKLNHIAGVVKRPKKSKDDTPTKRNRKVKQRKKLISESPKESTLTKKKSTDKRKKVPKSNSGKSDNNFSTSAKGLS